MDMDIWTIQIFTRRLDQQSRILQSQNYFALHYSLFSLTLVQTFRVGVLWPSRQDNTEPHLPGWPGISKHNDVWAEET